MSPFGSEPSEELTDTGCPTAAPATAAVPLVQVPADSAEPPMLPVVPESVDLVVCGLITSQDCPS